METAAPAGMRWTPRAALAEEALPNVMKKVLAHALDNAVILGRSESGDPRTSGRVSAFSSDGRVKPDHDGAHLRPTR